VREGRPVCKIAGERNRLALQGIGGDDAVEESPALAFVSRHGASGEEQLRRATLADDARQHRAGAHVAAGQAHAREEERGARGGGGDPQIGEQRDHRAGADAHAIDRRDDRLRTGAHRFHEIAGHACERQQPFHVACEQRADDLVNVAARGKVAAVRADYDRLDRLL
jgi:hypothetical protein